MDSKTFWDFIRNSNIPKIEKSFETRYGKVLIYDNDNVEILPNQEEELKDVKD